MNKSPESEAPALESIHVLTQIALLAEELNVLCWHQVVKTPSQQVQLQSPLLELRKRIASSVRRSRPFLGVSELSSLLRRAGLEPTFELSLVDQMCKIMLEPAQMSPTSNGEIALTGTPHLPTVQAPVYLHGRILLEAPEDVADNSGSAKYLTQPQKEVRITQWGEIIDPIAAIEIFLVNQLKIEPHNTDQLVQTWLRSAFAIDDGSAFRYALFNLCERLNGIFFGSAETSRIEIAASRSATVISRLVCKEMLAMLPEADDLTKWRQAVGIFLALRHAGFINCLLVSIDRHTETQGVLSKNINQQHHCSRAFKPIGYTHFLACLFGSSFGIEGLSDILMGGLLFHSDRGRSLVLRGRAGSGKTILALSMAVDIARKGGISLYLSMEESYAALVDRLVAFNLFDRRLFDIATWNKSTMEPEIPPIGKLMFYAHRENENMSVLDVIEKLGKARGWRRRSVIIDSVNALADDDVDRVSIMSVIEAIEAHKLFGVLVAEDAQRLSLDYLADTVIQLGSDETRQHRWLEVEKCRAQDFLPGRHLFKIADMSGLKCYPNLAGVRNSLRQRTQQPPSETRTLKFDDLQVWFPEKCSVMICGSPGTGKTILALNLLMTDSQQVGSKGQLAVRRPRHVLVVSFSIPRNRFFQMIRGHPELFTRSQKISRMSFKWVPPGDEISLEEVINDIQVYIRDSRRYGLPLERAVFHDVEAASFQSSPVSSETYFWPTLFELLRTEGVTSIYINNTGYNVSSGERLAQVIEAEADFSIEVVRMEDKSSRLTIHKQLSPHTPKVGSNSQAAKMEDSG